MDNAGENKLLQQKLASKDWKLSIKVEYTARDTPQQNSLEEVGFAMVVNRARAMMHHANIPMGVSYIISHEALACATLLDGHTAVTINNTTEKGLNTGVVNYQVL